MMKRIVGVNVAVACLLSVSLHADKADLAKAEPEVFLKYARQPFTQNAWGRFEGVVQHRGPGERYRMHIRLGLLLRRDFLRAQLVLDTQAVYNIMQIYYRDGPPNITVSGPDTPAAHGLEDLGIRPSDIAFSFLYWDFVREHESEKIRGHQCRVMTLQHPHSKEKAVVYFSAEYAFPLRVRMGRHKGQPDGSRTLEFTEFKREGDLWYVQTLYLRGPDWKTQVAFRKADMALEKEQAPPASLFLPEKLPVPEGE